MDVPNNETIHLPRYSVDRKCIEITEGVSSVPEYHFRDYDKLISIKFPLSIRRIGNYAFKGCSSLTMIFVPEGLSTIGVGCFCQCTYMSIVHKPKSGNDIKKEAFERCIKLVTVHLSNELKSYNHLLFNRFFIHIS